MKISDFTKNPRVEASIQKLKAHWKAHKKEISDIVDDKGNQYVDLVMEGGGVLGIALVGYTYALESVGIRFLGVGGTSAGAINALLVSALDTPDKRKSSKLLKALAEVKMDEFVDGDDDAQDMVEAVLEKAGFLKLLVKGIQVVDNFNEDLGLNPGDAFMEWLETQLKVAGIETLADLEDRMTPPKLKTREGKSLSKKEAGVRLAVVAADVTTETKVVFPDMADLYWHRPKAQNPAKFVRASMSIPAFFHPFKVVGIPRSARAREKWSKKAGYTGILPAVAVLVDGGVMSNFPINLFHVDDVPLAPTFGAKLGIDRDKPNEVDKPFQFAGAVFDSARHCLDYDFLHENPDYKQLVTFIPTRGHNGLDFFLGPEEKIDLFARGVEAAVEFLIGFDWAAYKNTRKLKKAYK